MDNSHKDYVPLDVETACVVDEQLLTDGFDVRPVFIWLVAASYLDGLMIGFCIRAFLMRGLLAYLLDGPNASSFDWHATYAILGGAIILIAVGYACSFTIMWVRFVQERYTEAEALSLLALVPLALKALHVDMGLEAYTM